MRPSAVRFALCVAVALLATAEGSAQPVGGWPACREQPNRACVLAEAMARLRDDAPPRGDPRFADWNRLLYLRLSEFAAATRDRALFSEARRSTEASPDAETRRSARRWVAAAQARAGFVEDAVHTLDAGDDGGFAADEIALALARSGRTEEALRAVGLHPVPAQVRTFVRLAQATKDVRYLQQAQAAARTLEDGYLQSALQPMLSVAYAELRDTDTALRLARGTAVSYHRAQALAGIATVTRNARLLSEARSFALGFDGRGHEDEVWAAMARAEIALGLLQEARRTLEAHLPREPSRALATAVGELAAAHWFAGERHVAEKLTDALLGGSWTIGEARAVLVRRLLAAGRFDEARQVSFLADEITFDNLSADIALKQAEAGAFREAIATADSIQHPARRSPTLAEIAALMPP